jgi:recombination protein RecA
MPVAKNKVKRVTLESDSPVETPKKNKADLTKLMSELNKKFGVNCVTLGVPKDEEGNPKTVERLSTGSITLDLALGGGIPEGRFIELSGAYSSTKTAQALHIIREAQQKGYICALVDVEGTTDEAFLEMLGVDTGTLLYSQPDGMEEACQLILDMQKSGEVQLCVLDSIAAMSPNKEQETSMEDTVRMGIPQQILGEFFRKFQANNNRLNREGRRPFTLIGINQLREKIGAYGD